MPEENNTVKMPCGTNHSCMDCWSRYSVEGCSHLKRMTDEEYEKHNAMLYAREARNDG